EKARQLIESRLPEIRSIVSDVLEAENSGQSYTVNYGKNVSFPVKLYDNLLYPAGEYEAVLITLGDGKGSNWWCVLFPPLCFLDFSNGTSVAETSGAEQQDREVKKEDDEEEDEVEVKFFLFEWLGWS